MAICYNKPLSPKNKWQTQKIHKQCKNASSSWNYNYYSNDSYKSIKISPFDLKDHDKSIKTNNIPIWTCSRCTFKNTKRKSHCTACNISYKQSKSLYIPSKSKSKSTSKQQHGFTNKPSNNGVILADFCNNIMDEINQSIPVWICNECTYCNIEQLAQCQMCLNSYHQNVQYTDLLTQSKNEQPETQENYEYFSAAEQKLILESVEFSTKKQTNMTMDKPPPKRKKFSIDFLKSFKTEKECQIMPENIINPIPDLFHKSSAKRKKFSMDKLMSFKNDISCKSMPESVITPIDDILAPGLGGNGRNKRAKFSVNQLRKLQNKDDFKIMPENIINEVPEILAPGLGTKLVKNKRCKISMDKLMGLRNKTGYKSMPGNVITAIPEILAPGLGSNANQKRSRAKFDMKQLMRFKDEVSCKLMPDNIINDIPEILAPKLGETKGGKRARFDMKGLLRFRNKASFKTMPDEIIINEVPEILAPGLGGNLSVTSDRARFCMDSLLDMRMEKEYKVMPENVINEAPEILAPGLGLKCGVRKRFGIQKLKNMGAIKSFKSMPKNVVNAVPEILAPGLGLRLDQVYDDGMVEAESRKYDMDKLMEMRFKDGYDDMPATESIINSVPEILAPGLGMKQNGTRSRRKYGIKELKDMRMKKGFQGMPDGLINDVPEILAAGLGMNTREKRRKFGIEELQGMRMRKDYQEMPDDLVGDIPSDIIAPGLGLGMKRRSRERRRKFSFERLISLRAEDGYDSMPSNIMSDTPEILAPGLGSDIGSGCDGDSGDDHGMNILEEDCGVKDLHFYNNEDEDDDDFGDGVEIVSEEQNHAYFNKGGYTEDDPLQLMSIRYPELTQSVKLNKKWDIDIEEYDNNHNSEILSFELNTLTIKDTENDYHTTIGFIAKRRFNNNYFVRYKRNEYNHYRQTEINNIYTKSCYFRDKKQVINDTKLNIQEYYPSNMIKKQSPRQQKMGRRKLKQALKQERNKLWENKKVADPRWNNKNKSNYKQLSQRYVTNKWCAYWKVSQI